MSARFFGGPTFQLTEGLTRRFYQLITHLLHPQGGLIFCDLRGNLMHPTVTFSMGDLQDPKIEVR